MRIWAIANQKGGVGKTTSTAMLAAELAARGERVLCLDIDPHASLSHYLRIDPDTASPSLADLFGGEIEHLQTLIHATDWQGVALATGGSRLATLDRHGRQGLGRVLGKALDQIRNDYDWVLIDCPPTLGVLTINALAACDLLLIPTQTEFLALKGLDGMLRTRDMVQKARGRDLPCQVVPTLFDGRTRACRDALADMQAAHPGLIAATAIPTDTKVREAAALGRPVIEHAPDCRAAQAFHELVGTLLQTDSPETGQAENTEMRVPPGGLASAPANHMGVQP